MVKYFYLPVIFCLQILRVFSMVLLICFHSCISIFLQYFLESSPGTLLTGLRVFLILPSTGIQCLQWSVGVLPKQKLLENRECLTVQLKEMIVKQIC